MGLASSCQSACHGSNNYPDGDPNDPFSFINPIPLQTPGWSTKKSRPRSGSPSLRKSASADDLLETYRTLPTPPRNTKEMTRAISRRSALSPQITRQKSSNARSIVRDLARKVDGARRISMPEWDQTFLSNWESKSRGETGEFQPMMGPGVGSEPSEPLTLPSTSWFKHENYTSTTAEPSSRRNQSTATSQTATPLHNSSVPETPAAARGSDYFHNMGHMVNSPCSGWDAGDASESVVSAHFRRSRTQSNRVKSKSSDGITNEFDHVDPTNSPRLDKRKSQVNFSQPSQTIILYDWDDTLFPTTFIRHDLELAWNEGLDPSRTDLIETFRTIEVAVTNMIEVACVLSEKVCIVTLAEPPWVSTSIKLFMPGLQEVIDSNEVEIVYARTYVDNFLCEQAYDRSTFQSDEDQFQFWINVKKRAIQAHIEKFYSKYEGQSWKNVLSIGDSEFEREATLQSTKAWQLNARHLGHDASMKVRAKVVKMLEDPTDEELLAELRLITSWLPSMVERNQGFDIDLEQSNDTMYELNDLLQVCVPDHEDDFWHTGDVPRDEVVTMSTVNDVVWKLSLGGKKGNANAYLRRLCWFSQKGRMWYDSVIENRPIPYVPSLISYKRYRLSEDEGTMVMNSGVTAYLFSVVSVEPPYTEYVIGCDTPYQRQRWVTEIKKLMHILP